MSSFKEWFKFQEKTVGTDPLVDVNPVMSNRAAETGATQILANKDQASQMANIMSLGRGNPSRATKDVMGLVGQQFNKMPTQVKANTDPTAVARSLTGKLNINVPGLEPKTRA